MKIFILLLFPLLALIKQDKNEFIIKAGETFVLKLQDNPSTGYYWTWINEDSTRLVKLSNKKYVSSTKKPVPGAGGILYLTFTGLKTGTDTIKLIHSRDLNKNQIPAKIILVRVIE